MYLGIINGWNEDGFKDVRSYGLDWVEFCVNYYNDSEEFLRNIDQIKEYSEKYGVKVGSIGRWGETRIKEDGSIDEDKLRHDLNLIEAAGKLGCPVYNCGCNYTKDKTYKENCEIAIDYFKILLEKGSECGVKIAVYNCDWGNFVFNEKAWNIILPELPDLGIKYDTSHCLGRHGDYLREMRDWGERIYHFHLKGSIYIDGKHYDDPPMGLDQVNWGAVMDLLYTKNYNAMLSIEPHSSYWNGNKGQWGIEFSINYIKPFIMPESYQKSEKSPYMP